MNDLMPTKKRVVGLPHKKEEAIEVLNECFSRNLIELDEFESRIEIVEKAQSIDEIEELLSDIPPDFIEKKEQKKAVIPLSHKERIKSVFTTKTISGIKLYTKSLHLKAVFSTLQIDYRNLDLPEGMITVHMKAVRSTCSIIVPPGVRVQNDMKDVMSTITEDKAMQNSSLKAKTVIRLKGKSVMSKIDIQVNA